MKPDDDLIKAAILLLEEAERTEQRIRIARKVGVSPGTITKWLNPHHPNMPRGRSLDKIFQAYGGGMDPRLIARLIHLFKNQSSILKQLADIEEKADSDDKAMIHNIISVLAKKLP